MKEKNLIMGHLALSLFFILLIICFFINFCFSANFLSWRYKNIFLIMSTVLLFLLVYFIIIAKRSWSYLKDISNKDEVIQKDLMREFENMYNLYFNNFNELESLRKKIRNVSLGGYLVMIIVVILLLQLIPNIIKILDTNLIVYMLTSLLIIIITTVIYVCATSYSSEYTKKYKMEKFSSLLASINNQLRYDYENNNKEEITNHYLKSNIDYLRYKNVIRDYEIKHYENVYGYLDEKTYMQMASINVAGIPVVGKNSLIFTGRFVLIEYNKNIDVDMSITRKIEHMFNEETQIKLDNVEFEKYFDVYSKNKELTMQLLTTNMMNALINLYKKYNIIFEIVLKDKQLYIRLWDVPIYAPNIYIKSFDKKNLFCYYCKLKFTIEIIKEIHNIFNKNY